MSRKIKIILIFFIMLNYLTLYQKLLAAKAPKTTKLSTVNQTIIGNWLGKGINTYSGQSYEIALQITKQSNNHLDCSLQITDSEFICKHYLEISQKNYKYYFKDLASEAISGQPKPGSILQQIWTSIVLQPIDSDKKLVGTALINQDKLSLRLDKKNDNNNIAKSSKPSLTTIPNTQKLSPAKPVDFNKDFNSESAKFNNNNANISDLDNSDNLNTTSDNSIITANDKISSAQTNSPKYEIKDLLEDTNSNSNIPDKYKLPPNKVLQAGIEHSASLEPVPAYLRAGTVYDENLLKSQIKSSRIWYRIPNWLAGSWHQSYEFVLKSTNPILDPPGRILLSECDYNFGIQIDKYSNIWDTIMLPIFTEINAHNEASEVVKCMKYYYKPGDYLSSNYTKLSRSCEIYINKFTNRITKVLQNEVISTSTLMEPGVVRCLSSVNWYNDYGMPLSKDQRVTFIKLKTPFVPINFSKEGLDLKADFIQYLRNHDLDNLIPN